MAYELTWAFDTNHVVGDVSTVAKMSAWQLWYIGAFLLGNTNAGSMSSGTWTFVSSSNSTSQGTTDYLHLTSNGAFTSGDWVNAASGAHSWYVLKSPAIGGVNYHLIVDYISANSYQARFIFCKTAPTGGSTSARPTSVDEWIPGGTSATINLNNNSAVARKMHGGLTSRGDFYVMGSRDTSGVCDFGLIFEVLANTKAGDPYPAWSYAYGSGASTTTLFSGGTAAGSLDSYQATAAPACRYYDNSAQTAAPIFAYSQATVTIFNAMTAADVVDSSWPDMPIWVTMTTSGAAIKSIKGRLQDFALCPTSLGSGQTDGASPTKGVVGNLWIPLATAMSL